MATQKRYTHNADNEDTKYFCMSMESPNCSEYIHPTRALHLQTKQLHPTCHACGEYLAKQVKHIVQIPYSKGAYQYIHNPLDLHTTNPKRTS